MIKIIYNSNNILVVDKPIGVSVHNDDWDESLIQIIKKNYPSLDLFPIHRLDKETSGIQIFALSSAKAKELGKELQSEDTVKVYIGILRGKVEEASGSWSLPLTDKSEGRKNPQGIKNQRISCRTDYTVLKSNSYFSLCEFKIYTGRQHQIRKHAALSKHAIVGDDRYGEPKYNKKMAQIYNQNRMYLHCHKMTLIGHTFISETPKDFNGLFA
jgi:23S rRNA-/tRNA-specific pseudouridylate synthase